ncbi:hypothetical protein [Streptacidiphilus sp. PAMC 29251]
MDAKEDLRAAARVLRTEGKTYDEIREALGVSKSSVSLWVRDLPHPPRRQSPQERRDHMQRICWGPLRERRDGERRAAKQAAASEIGELSDRELFVLGVGIYWSEGTKDKEYARRESVTLINSDAGLIAVYLAWLDLLAVERSRLRFRVSIHESADVDAAQRTWAELIGLPVEALQRVNLKQHNPRTTRHNTGADYKGCLIVKVLDGADLYRRIEGWWSGLVVEAKRRNP